MRPGRIHAAIACGSAPGAGVDYEHARDRHPVSCSRTQKQLGCRRPGPWPYSTSWAWPYAVTRTCAGCVSSNPAWHPSAEKIIGGPALTQTMKPGTAPVSLPAWRQVAPSLGVEFRYNLNILGTADLTRPYHRRLADARFCKPIPIVLALGSYSPNCLRQLGSRRRSTRSRATR